MKYTHSPRRGRGSRWREWLSCCKFAWKVFQKNQNTWLMPVDARTLYLYTRMDGYMFSWGVKIHLWNNRKRNNCSICLCNAPRFRSTGKWSISEVFARKMMTLDCFQRRNKEQRRSPDQGKVIVVRVIIIKIFFPSRAYVSWPIFHQFLEISNYKIAIMYV